MCITYKRKRNPQSYSQSYPHYPQVVIHNQKTQNCEHNTYKTT